MSSTHDDLVRQVEGKRDDVERLFGLLETDPDEYTLDDYTFLVEQGAGLPDLLEQDPDDETPADEFDPLEDARGEMNDATYVLLGDEPLEVVQHGTRTRVEDGWELHHVVVLYCVGGPHVELNTGTRQWVGYWGGDKVYRGASDELCAWWEDAFTE